MTKKQLEKEIKKIISDHVGKFSKDLGDVVQKGNINSYSNTVAMRDEISWLFKKIAEGCEFAIFDLVDNIADKQD